MEREQDVVGEWSRKTDEPFCFVVAGETGAGKSTLLNSLANKDIAETSSEADSMTEKVTIYDKEIELPQSDGTNSKSRVRAVDTPGLNDVKKTYEEIFNEVSEKVPQPHALFYCFSIGDRFRLSDQQLLSAMSKSYGVDIWKRVVIVLTHADAVRTPMKDMESRKKSITKFLSDKIMLAKNVVSKIPFRLAAMKPDFKPPDYDPTIAEGQIPDYNWKIELLSAAVSVVPPEIVPLIVKLHEIGVLAWCKRNGITVTGTATALATIVWFAAGNPAVVAPIATAAARVAVPLATAAARYVTQSSVRRGAEIVGFSSGSYLIQACYAKFKEYMQNRQGKEDESNTE